MEFTGLRNHSILTLLAILLAIVGANAQQASRIIGPQAATAGRPTNIVFVDTTAGEQFRFRVARMDSLQRTLSDLDSIYTITRTLNSNFKPSVARHSFVIYSVSILSSNNNNGMVFLEYSPDAITWAEASRFTSQQQGGNAQTATCALMGRIPRNYFVRIRTVLNGTTITFISGQETLL